MSCLEHDAGLGPNTQHVLILGGNESLLIGTAGLEEPDYIVGLFVSRPGWQCLLLAMEITLSNRAREIHPAR
jgi:hypothetical protein